VISLNKNSLQQLTTSIKIMQNMYFS